MTTAIPAVYAAISACTADLLGGVAKGQRNAAQGFNFRGIDQLMNAVAPVISRNGLVILPRVLERSREERETAKGGAMHFTHIRVAFDFVSVKDGSMHTVETFGEAQDSGDKSTNKAMSAALKYALMQAFMIPTEDMADADAHNPEPSKRAKPIAMPDRNPALAWMPAKDALKDRINAAKSIDALSEVRTSPEWQALVRGDGVPSVWIEGLKTLAQERANALV